MVGTLVVSFTPTAAHPSACGRSFRSLRLDCARTVAAALQLACLLIRRDLPTPELPTTAMLMQSSTFSWPQATQEVPGRGALKELCRALEPCLGKMQASGLRGGGNGMDRFVPGQLQAADNSFSPLHAFSEPLSRPASTQNRPLHDITAPLRKPPALPLFSQGLWPLPGPPVPGRQAG